MSQITPRDYQEQAITIGVEHMMNGKGNGFMVLPTGSGKSIVIAGVADKLEGPVLVFQPSVEILYQNYEKMVAYGHLPAIFSASANEKSVGHITFATIGSVINKKDLFKHFKHVIVDECHLVSPDSGTMYRSFLEFMEEANGVRPRMLGVTATPYRLKSTMAGSQINMLNRMSPGIWNKMLYYVQISELRKRGYLAEMEYFRTQGIDVMQLRSNSNGSEFTDASVRAAWESSGMTPKVVNMVERLLVKRKSVLVFVPTVAEAEEVAKFLSEAEWVCGETPKGERDRIIGGFRGGEIRCVVNVGVLTTGFDYPELDTLVLARPTKSLSLFCQMTGRAMRPHPTKKSGWVVDMVGLVNTFGPMEDLEVGVDKKGLDCIYGMIPRKDADPYRKQLTNVSLNPQQAKMYFGKKSFARRW